MMHTRWKRGAALLGLLALATLPVPAEVSVDATETGFHVIILGVTEGPDPWSMIWDPHRDIEESRILNRDGSTRGDGRPDVANPDQHTNVVVWAYNASGDHDIAFSEWTGESWSEPLFLTDGTTDELDPRVLITSNGNVHVAWWVKQTKNLYLATRLGHSNVWGLPREIETPLGGARPSLADFETKLHMAYEQFSVTPGVAKDIVVARRTGALTFEYVTVGQSQRVLDNDPIMHVSGDVAWVDWKHSDDAFGFAVYRNGLWGPMQTMPWPDPSWVGQEDTRLAIRAHVLSPDDNEQNPVHYAAPRLGNSESAGRFQLPYREGSRGD